MSEKIKVSELEASTTTDNSDLVMIVQSNNGELNNYKQTRQNFLKPIYDEIGDLDTILQSLDTGNGVS